MTDMLFRKSKCCRPPTRYPQQAACGTHSTAWHTMQGSISALVVPRGAGQLGQVRTPAAANWARHPSKMQRTGAQLYLEHGSADAVPACLIVIPCLAPVIKQPQQHAPRFWAASHMPSAIASHSQGTAPLTKQHIVCRLADDGRGNTAQPPLGGCSQPASHSDGITSHWPRW
jgi:hypothetical protein